MRDKINVCLTCLSSDRRLIPLNTIKSLMQKINFAVELKNCTGGVCWECHRIMVKFHSFHMRVQAAQECLSQQINPHNLKSLTTLASKTNLLYDYQYTYNLDPLTNCDTEPKSEQDYIKQELYEPSDDNIDFTSDDLINENYYDDLKKTNQNIKLLKKERKRTRPDKEESKEKFVEMGLTKDEILGITVDINEKLDGVSGIIENVFVESIETELNKKLHRKAMKRTRDRNNKTILRKQEKRTKIDEREVKEKFVEVILSEEEMIRIREEKRNHHNFKKIPYKCDSCVLGFTRKENYSIHLKKKHDKSIGEHLCNVCNIRFANKQSVEKHKKKHYVCYRCRLCKYEAHELWSAFNHCKIKHIADTPDSIHCTQCDAVVKTPEGLEEHIQREHTLYCNECGVKFKGKNTLRRHMARIHAVKREFICDICTKTFKTKTRLESHMVTHNSSIAKKLAYCQLCKIQYKNIYVYRNHLKYSSNHSERAYPCPECNKKFASKVYWTKHYNFYHLQKSQFNCEICNKLFISDWRLKNHRQKHHGLSRSRDHPCNVCGKTFYTIATLRGHQLTHSEQRTYMCEDCGDTFKQRPALYTHSRLVHRGGGRRK